MPAWNYTVPEGTTGIALSIMEPGADEAVLEHYDAALIDHINGLSGQAAPALVKAFAGLETAELGREAQQLDRTAREHAQAAASGWDWRGGYQNSDDDDMEEGIGA